MPTKNVGAGEASPETSTPINATVMSAFTHDTQAPARWVNFSFDRSSCWVRAKFSAMALTFTVPAAWPAPERRLSTSPKMAATMNTSTIAIPCTGSRCVQISLGEGPMTELARPTGPPHGSMFITEAESATMVSST